MPIRVTIVEPVVTEETIHVSFYNDNPAGVQVDVTLTVAGNNRDFLLYPVNTAPPLHPPQRAPRIYLPAYARRTYDLDQWEPAAIGNEIVVHVDGDEAARAVVADLLVQTCIS